MAVVEKSTLLLLYLCCFIFIVEAGNHDNHCSGEEANSEKSEKEKWLEGKKYCAKEVDIKGEHSRNQYEKSSLSLREKDSLRTYTNDGISSLQRTLSAIESYHPSKGQFLIYSQTTILPPCSKMAGYFSSLKDTTDVIVKRIDENIESTVHDLTLQKENFEDLDKKIKILTSDIEKKEKDVTDANNRVVQTENEFRNEEMRLSSLRRQLSDAEERKTLSGFGTFFTGALAMAFPNPVTIALAAGNGILLGTSHEEVRMRENAVRAANDVYSESLNRKDKKINELTKFRLELQDAKTEFEEVKTKVLETELYISQLRNEQKNAAKSQEIVRNICREVSDVESAAKVLLFETDGGYTVEPLMTSMNELLKYVGNLSHQKEYSEFLSPHSVNLLQNRLKALDDKNKNRQV